MASDVIMPQMGESIAEGTMVKWLKGVGDTIKRDEPLFEISTDKVDAEIPAPAEGVLLEILVVEGETVEINTVVGRIGAAGEAAGTPAPAAPAAAPETPAEAPAAAPAAPAPVPTAPGAAVRTSPVVQKIAAEHGVDVSQISGTGAGGRITKKDIMGYIEGRGSAPPAAPAATPASAAAPAALVATMAFPAGQNEVREPMSVMRQKIGEHMVMSKRTSPHVYSVFEVDMHEIFKKRTQMKPEFAKEGAKLTFLPYFIEAVIRGLKEYPVVNATIDGTDIVYKKNINVGIAVALENGLIVPVIKSADQMNLLGLTKATADLADRARSKKLVPDDVQGGTFTITNVGVFGGLFGMAVINQPQAAILGIGTIVKRPVVVNDAIAIRPIVYLSLSYDHRLVDGADASKFLSVVKRELEKPAV
jgi:pyruvate dehydrogenase E2 component (dihydrolipoamide acetyltransferase)